jgi:hypothetical protein
VTPADIAAEGRLRGKEDKVRAFPRISFCLFLFLPAALAGQWAATYKAEFLASKGAADGGVFVSTYDLASDRGSLLRFSSLGGLVWGKTFAGTFSAVWPTADGGCYAANDSINSAGVRLIRMSPAGEIVWKMGSTREDIHLFRFCPTPDGGMIMAGSLAGSDLIVRKCSPAGAIEWQKSYGTAREEAVSGLAATADGDYVLLAWSYPGVPVSPPPDLWILRLSSDGEILWQKLFGEATDTDEADIVLPTADGGVLVSGAAGSFSATHNTESFLMKLSPAGAVEWGLTLPSINRSSVDLLTDGRFAVTSEFYNASTMKIDRTAILIVSPGGAVLDRKAFSMAPYHTSWRAKASGADGGLLLIVNTSTGGDSDLYKDDNAYVMKFSSAGEIEWQKRYGGEYSVDRVLSVDQAPGGGFLLCGSTDSWNGRKLDSWIMKLRPDGSINPLCYFVKDAAATAVEAPAVPIAFQAAGVDTTAAAQSVVWANETLDLAFATATEGPVPLGQPTCTLTLVVKDIGANTPPPGTTSPAPGAHVYNTGDVVEIAATPNSGIAFVAWTGNLIIDRSPLSIVMDGDKTVNATFRSAGGGGGGGGGGGEDEGRPGPCFIATTAYGSPDHPCVRALRAFRDRYLMRSRPGRSFVDLYYRLSPPVARFVGKHAALRAASRIALVPAVALSYALTRFGPIPTAFLAFLAAALMWRLASRRRRVTSS